MILQAGQMVVIEANEIPDGRNIQCHSSLRIDKPQIAGQFRVQFQGTQKLHAEDFQPGTEELIHRTFHRAEGEEV